MHFFVQDVSIEFISALNIYISSHLLLALAVMTLEFHSYIYVCQIYFTSILNGFKPLGNYVFLVKLSLLRFICFTGFNNQKVSFDVLFYAPVYFSVSTTSY